MMNNEALIWVLKKEYEIKDRSGIYGYTQRTLAYAKLMELYHLAASQAKLFITSFDGYLSEKQELDPIFDYTFNGALAVSEENI